MYPGMSDEKLWVKVRGEVDRMLKKHGIGRRHEKRELGHESDVSAKEKQREKYEVAEPETLSSVRYELVKMQQELIRRKVLDPHHYAALSVDTLIPQREKETQNQNINIRFSERGFMEGKAAAGPAKVMSPPLTTPPLTTHPLTTYSRIIHPLITSNIFTLNIPSDNTPYQNAPYQHTLSTHPIVTHSLQPTLSTHPIKNPILTSTVTVGQAHGQCSSRGAYTREDTKAGGNTVYVCQRRQGCCGDGA